MELDSVVSSSCVVEVEGDPDIEFGNMGAAVRHIVHLGDHHVARIAAAAIDISAACGPVLNWGDTL